MKPVKLTWETVDRIRERYEPGICGYKTLARMVSVSPQTIKLIIRGEIWSPDKDWRKLESA